MIWLLVPAAGVLCWWFLRRKRKPGPVASRTQRHEMLLALMAYIASQGDLVQLMAKTYKQDAEALRTFLRAPEDVAVRAGFHAEYQDLRRAFGKLMSDRIVRRQVAKTPGAPRRRPREGDEGATGVRTLKSMMTAALLAFLDSGRTPSRITVSEEAMAAHIAATKPNKIQLGPVVREEPTLCSFAYGNEKYFVGVDTTLRGHAIVIEEDNAG